MKKTAALPLALLIIFSACTSNEKASSAPESVPQKADTQNVSWSGCYEMNIEKDSAEMQLHDSAGYFTGPLTYRRFQKDKNTGYVTLKKDSSRLSGNYKFLSEGMISVRQVIFKPVNGNLAEAYGEIEMRGDTAVYKYPVQLQFEEHPFRKINCK